ncbi:aldo/keto reductase [Roseateles cellulosilyticus]|uniref:Aldo/keto reductase n=1 Tax=Pelomonas cellulosilytica TaxID=2906762 RepID=A0ABS8Y2I4_9BURK|nr:aldo/keto reductase [Pelomonas sp. P8]MCE4556110.1 aldo/keto reductase [Pelomonas sp. P8]
MELAIGTVQFGLAYGVVGSGQRVDDAMAAAILDAAWQQGVRTLDTAAAYGDIEQRLAGLCGSHAFKVVSKVRPLGAVVGSEARIAAVRDSVAASIDRLGSRLHALMFHSAADLLADDGPALWDAALTALAGRDVLAGVSCYGPEELLTLCERLDIRLAQLPANALDQRLHDTLADAAQAARLAGVALHVRSAFLQGLLLSPGRGAERVPAAAAALRRWQDRCHSAALDGATAALGVVKALPNTQACVVGIETLAQWQEVNAAWARATPLRWPELACSDPQAYDPRLWSKT